MLPTHFYRLMVASWYLASCAIGESGPELQNAHFQGGAQVCAPASWQRPIRTPEDYNLTLSCVQPFPRLERQLFLVARIDVY